MKTENRIYSQIDRHLGNEIELYLEIDGKTFSFSLEYDISNLTSDDYDLDVRVIEGVEYTDGDEQEYSVNVDMYHIIYDCVSEYFSDYDFWSEEEYSNECDRADDFNKQSKLSQW
jgi:hypothetical protein